MTIKSTPSTRAALTDTDLPRGAPCTTGGVLSQQHLNLLQPRLRKGRGELGQLLIRHSHHAQDVSENEHAERRLGRESTTQVRKTRDRAWPLTTPRAIQLAGPRAWRGERGGKLPRRRRGCGGCRGPRR